jgi:hypothetical protein
LFREPDCTISPQGDFVGSAEAAEELRDRPYGGDLPEGPLPITSDADGIGNSVITPDVVMRPILFPDSSVNQILPSGPAAMPKG